MKQKLLQTLNTLLAVDAFLVFFAFMWLATAVTGRSLGVSLGLDLWYKLWEPLFMPAIGALMAGALLSGAASYVSKRFPSQQ